MFFGFIFLLIVVLCLLAPVYSSDIAHIGPDTDSHRHDQARPGKLVYSVNAVGIPIGPTWNISHFFLGADEDGPRRRACACSTAGATRSRSALVAMLITMVFGTMLGIDRRLLPRAGSTGSSAA